MFAHCFLLLAMHMNSSKVIIQLVYAFKNVEEQKYGKGTQNNILTFFLSNVTTDWEEGSGYV
jgi:hypothetical protein